MWKSFVFVCGLILQGVIFSESSIFNIKKVSLQFKLGQTIKLDCTLDSGEAFLYVWKLPNDEDGNSNTPVWTKDSAELSDSGIYTCTVNADAGSDTKTFEVTVYEESKFVVHLGIGIDRIQLQPVFGDEPVPIESFNITGERTSVFTALTNSPNEYTIKDLKAGGFYRIELNVTPREGVDKTHLLEVYLHPPVPYIYVNRYYLSKGVIGWKTHLPFFTENKEIKVELRYFNIPPSEDLAVFLRGEEPECVYKMEIPLNTKSGCLSNMFEFNTRIFPFNSVLSSIGHIMFKVRIVTIGGVSEWAQLLLNEIKLD